MKLFAVIPWIVIFITFGHLLPITLKVTSVTTSSGIIIDTGFKVIAFEFNGSTTDFLHMSDEQLGNMSGMVLEKSGVGKITFSVPINLTEVHENRVVNIDEHVEIQRNMIEINTSYFTNFVRSAQVSLSGLTFSNPRILRNGALCPSSICTLVRYSSQTLVFNVTNFSYYSAEETPQPPSPPGGGKSGGGGGGGGGGGSSDGTMPSGNTIITRDFLVNPTEINASMHLAETRDVVLTVTNTGPNTMLFSLEQLGLQQFLSLSRNTFSLPPQSSENITLHFVSRDTDKPDVYTGAIIIHTGFSNFTVFMNLFLEEQQTHFSVTVTLKKSFLSNEDPLTSTIDIISYINETIRNATLQFFIKDSIGQEQKVLEETLNIEKKTKIIRTIPLPPLESGRYILVARLEHQERASVGHAQFTIGNEIPYSPINAWRYWILIAIILLILISIVVYHIRRGNIYSSLVKEINIMNKNKTPEKGWIPSYR